MKVLIDREALATRIAAMGATLSERFRGEEIVAIVVLRGAMFFAADLLRAMPEVDVRIRTLRAASYAGTRRAGPVRLMHGTVDDVQGRHVLILEDILDSGHTAAFLRDLVGRHDPRSVTVAALLDKPSRREVDEQADLVGFAIDDHFVVGFGLDLDQRFRHLDHIAIVEDGDT